MKKIIAFVFVSFIAIGGAVWAAEGDVRYLSTPDYFDALTAEIRAATSSITACMYRFNLIPNRAESKPLLLADALSDAQKRGVKVTVILDAGALGFEQAAGAGPEEGPNGSAYEYLRQRGVDVTFSSGSIVVHAKTVVVDESVVIAGSFNWSEAALSHNLESGLLVRDPEAARAALEDIQRAGRRDMPAPQAATAFLPASFFTDAKYLGTMVTRHEEMAFDTYLFILKEGAGKTRFDLDTKALAKHLGIDDRLRSDYRSVIFKVLRTLQSPLGLIRVSFVFGKEPAVEVLPLPGDAVDIPPDYFSWGWNRRLGLHGKAMYFVSRRYTEQSSTRPRWSKAVLTIAGENHLHPDNVWKGTFELRRANLLEVEYDSWDKTGQEPRHPNIYTSRPLYDPAVLDQKWKDLASRYGDDKLERARRCLALVFEDSAPDAAEMFIKAEEEYGKEKVNEAYKVIEKKRADNPCRTVGYFLGVIKGIPDNP